MCIYPESLSGLLLTGLVCMHLPSGVTAMSHSAGRWLPAMSYHIYTAPFGHRLHFVVVAAAGHVPVGASGNALAAGTLAESAASLTMDSG